MAFRVINDETATQAQQPSTLGKIGQFFKRKGVSLLDDIAEDTASIGKTGQFIKEQARPYIRQGVNLASLAIGTPGDLLKTANELVARPLVGAITGGETLPYEQTYLNKLIPTSQQAKSSLQSLSPEYLAPEGEAEELLDAIVEDTTALYAGRQFFRGKMPFANTLSKGQQLLRSVGISVGSNLAETVVKDFTNDDTAAGWTKFGTALFLSMFDKPKAGQYVGQAYKKADGLLPSDARQNANKLSSKLNSIQLKVSKGTLAPSEKFIVQEADEILNRIRYDPVSGDRSLGVGMGAAMKRSLNEKLEEFVFKNPTKLSKSRARQYGTRIVKALNEFLDDYGKTNPEWIESFREAEQGYATLATSNKVTDYIKNNLKKTVLSAGLLKTLGIPISGKAAAVGSVAYPSAQVAYRIAKSPLLREYYGKVIKAAVQENSALMNKELSRLDSELQKPDQSASSSSSGRFRVID